MEGRLAVVLQSFQTNSTPFELSMSGINLGPVRCKMLASNLAYNNSLLSLHLQRKGIQDNEGCDLAKMLLTNTSLRKLELEGNSLGL